VKFNKLMAAVAIATLSTTALTANAAANYADFPITVKDYAGDKTSSISYDGQIARHVLHTSLMSLSKTGNGEANPELLAKMQAYFSGKDTGRAIISPASKEGFGIAQTQVDELSKGKNLAGKTYQGAVAGWPGNKTAVEVLEFLIEKAASSDAGFDYINGMDYPQLISKFAMGAIFYNQAVDNYLDEKLAADVKPNNKPYKDGAAYTGKEHVWDEAFGYFGAPTNAASIDATDAYSIAKGKKEIFAKADLNGNGKIELDTEMLFAHAYYAAGADKSGKSNYLNSITQAFIDGRQIITDAKGEKLNDQQRKDLLEKANFIKTNWELVIAEAAFKYAGSVYSDALKLQAGIEANSDVKADFKNYIHHWGELKGFSMALQTGGKDLGGFAVKLNRLIGFSPVLLGNTQVTGIDDKGNYIQSSSLSLNEFALHMLKVQKALSDQYPLKARAKDQTAKLATMAEKLGSGNSTEND